MVMNANAEKANPVTIAVLLIVFMALSPTIALFNSEMARGLTP